MLKFKHAYSSLLKSPKTLAIDVSEKKAPMRSGPAERLPQSYYSLYRLALSRGSLFRLALDLVGRLAWHWSASSEGKQQQQTSNIHAVKGYPCISLLPSMKLSRLR